MQDGIGASAGLFTIRLKAACSAAGVALTGSFVAVALTSSSSIFATACSSLPLRSPASSAPRVLFLDAATSVFGASGGG